MGEPTLQGERKNGLRMGVQQRLIGIFRHVTYCVVLAHTRTHTTLNMRAYSMMAMQLLFAYLIGVHARIPTNQTFEYLVHNDEWPKEIRNNFEANLFVLKVMRDKHALAAASSDVQKVLNTIISEMELMGVKGDTSDLSWQHGLEEEGLWEDVCVLCCSVLRNNTSSIVILSFSCVCVCVRVRSFPTGYYESQLTSAFARITTAIFTPQQVLSAIVTVIEYLDDSFYEYQYRECCVFSWLWCGVQRVGEACGAYSQLMFFFFFCLAHRMPV